VVHVQEAFLQVYRLLGALTRLFTRLTVSAPPFLALLSLLLLLLREADSLILSLQQLRLLLK